MNNTVFMSFSTKGIPSDLTQEDVLELVGEYNLWQKYAGVEVIIGKKILSPVEDETDPSAGFFISKTGSILLKDFRFGTYNIWSFLKLKKGWNIKEALFNIDKDFNLGFYTPKRDNIPEPEKKQCIQTEKEQIKIFVKTKEWEENEIQFWKQYHVSPQAVSSLKISPVSKYWIQKNEELLLFTKKKDELLFAFCFGKNTYKMYRPYGDRKSKWYSNTSGDILMGYDTLPAFADLCIITKGMKELCILRTLEYPSIALQGETSYPDKTTAAMLRLRFKNIYCLMDSDEAGKRATQDLINKYNYLPIYLPESSEYKDLADYARINGIEKTKQLLPRWK